MSKKRILIVEDELIIAEDLRMSLEERGYEIVDIVFNPEQAVVKCRETPPKMPGGTITLTIQARIIYGFGIMPTQRRPVAP